MRGGQECGDGQECGVARSIAVVRREQQELRHDAVTVLAMARWGWVLETIPSLLPLLSLLSVLLLLPLLSLLS